jgi:hypothetical protein
MAFPRGNIRDGFHKKLNPSYAATATIRSTDTLAGT